MKVSALLVASLCAPGAVVAKAPPDGYTILFGASSVAIGASYSATTSKNGAKP